MLLLALVVLQGRQELPVLLLLLEDCSAKVEAVAVEEQAAPEVQAVLEVAVLAVVAVAQHAVHTPLALVVWVALAGHWYWSFDYAAICRC